jgi:hypothetical protein
MPRIRIVDSKIFFNMVVSPVISNLASTNARDFCSGC